jgi:drug/metabolite transporter (DMT)-like permease
MSHVFVPWEEVEAARADEPATSAAAAAPAAGETARSHLLGLVMVALSSVAFSSSNLFINVLSASTRISAYQIAFVRFAFQAAFSVLATVVVHRGRLRDRRTWLGVPGNEFKLLSRGVVGTAGLVFFVMTLSRMTLSDASAITFLNIPLTAIFARLLFKEEYTFFDAATGALGVVGVVLVAQPASLFGAAEGIVQRELSALSVVIGLCAATFTSFAFLAIRRIGSGEDVFVITLWFSVVGLCITPILMVATGPWVTPSTPAALWLLIGVGCTGFIGQLLLNKGMSQAPAGPASVMRYADLLNALWMQSLILGDVPNVLKVLGCMLVLSSILSTIDKSRRKAAREKAKAAAAAAPSEMAATAPSEAATAPLAAT